MKLIYVQFKIIFNKKPLLRPKEHICEFFIYVPREWDEDQVKAFSSKVAKKHVKSVAYSAYKKGAYKLIFNEFRERAKIHLKSGTMIYQYNPDKDSGEWAIYSDISNLQ